MLRQMTFVKQKNIQFFLIWRAVLSISTWLIIFVVYGQNETTNWFFGCNAGVCFTNGLASSNTDGKINSGEGCATISDKTGRLLFYTDGLYVWNRNHKTMPNGEKLYGHTSSTQSAYIVPKPSSSSIYYIFTLDCEAGERGVCYSIVDMNRDEGFGEVTDKNVLLRNKCVEKIAVFKHENKNDIWVLIHDFNSNAFVAYLLTKNGISTTPVISNAGIRHEINKYNNIGYMKFSADGNKLAVAINGMDCVQLFDFNNKSGIVSNPITIQFPKNSKPYGVEFSPNGNFLYISLINGGKVFQANLTLKTESAISKSLTLIGQSKNRQSIGALQLAVDNKIYVSENMSNYLAAIEQPDSAGLQCHYNSEKVFLKGKFCTLGLPIFYLTSNQYQKKYQYFDSKTIVQLNKKYVLSNVLFDTDRAMLDPESKSTLMALLNYLKINRKVKIEIIGHTDAVGSVAHNNKLSLHRAIEVRRFLTKNNIEIARISVSGKGFSDPIDDNDTETGRHRNRRIEFFLKN